NVDVDDLRILGIEDEVLEWMAPLEGFTALPQRREVGWKLIDDERDLGRSVRVVRVELEDVLRCADVNHAIGGIEDDAARLIDLLVQELFGERRPAPVETPDRANVPAEAPH